MQQWRLKREARWAKQSSVGCISPHAWKLPLIMALCILVYTLPLSLAVSIERRKFNICTVTKRLWTQTSMIIKIFRSVDLHQSKVTNVSVCGPSSVESHKHFGLWTFISRKLQTFWSMDLHQSKVTNVSVRGPSSVESHKRFGPWSFISRKSVLTDEGSRTKMFW